MREKCYGNELLEKELRACFDFFYNEANIDENSKGYGLIIDKTIYDLDVSSVAAVGYGLAALVIGIKHNYISYEEGYNRVNKTLDTFLNNVECKNGFFYHFVSMDNGKRVWNCELSIVDTAIFICGAITAGEFFEGEIKKKAEELYKNINWKWYTNENGNYYMGYLPEEGFAGDWDKYAEHLMMILLGVASPTYNVDKKMYDNMEKDIGRYRNIHRIIHSYYNPLFVYQFSHAWIDFKDTKDSSGINWFENSVKATRANRQYCIDNKYKFKTFSENSWGTTACIGPEGYNGAYGATLNTNNVLENETDGTVAPSGSLSSIIFMPKEAIAVAENLYNSYDKVWSKYGFVDAYNLEKEDEPWFSDCVFAINKGNTMLMIENYFSNLIHNLFMNNKYVKQGMKILGIKKEI